MNQQELNEFYARLTPEMKRTFEAKLKADRVPQKRVTDLQEILEFGLEAKGFHAENLGFFESLVNLISDALKDAEQGFSSDINTDFDKLLDEYGKLRTKAKKRTLVYQFRARYPRLFQRPNQLQLPQALPRLEDATFSVSDHVRTVIQNNQVRVAKAGLEVLSRLTAGRSLASMVTETDQRKRLQVLGIKRLSLLTAMNKYGFKPCHRPVDLTVVHVQQFIEFLSTRQ